MSKFNGPYKVPNKACRLRSCSEEPVRIKGPKPSSKNAAQKRKLRNRELVIEPYYKWVKSLLGDGHHWLPRSEIGRNDFFLIPMAPEDHQRVHATLGVKQFIEEQGGFTAMVSFSVEAMRKYLIHIGKEELDCCGELHAMLREIDANPIEAVAITQRYAQQYMEHFDGRAA